VRVRTRVDPDIASVAALIADPSRLAMLEALLGGRPLGAGELARRAGIGASTTSFHLARLVAGRLVVRRRRGRAVELALASRAVAAALEALARLAPARPPLTVEGRRVAAELRALRSCYDHLAGRVGVAITDGLVACGVLRATASGLTLGRDAAARLVAIGLPLDLGAAGRRPLVRACLDWSERRPHLAGALGERLAERLWSERLLSPVRGSRALRLTRRGEEWLRGFVGAV
jgi:DNA-binding transcriptional ArsR family regulator